MQRGRWYPTATTMADGEVVITAGTDEEAVNVLVPEVWTAGILRSLTGASRSPALLPAGVPGAERQAVLRRLAADHPVPRHKRRGHVDHGRQSQGRGSRERLRRDVRPGRILYAGGGRTTNTAEIIDLNKSAPAWTATGSMQFARHHHNLTLLPTGEVLATGGVAGTADNDLSQAVLRGGNLELFDRDVEDACQRRSGTGVSRDRHSVAGRAGSAGRKRRGRRRAGGKEL